MTSKRVHYTILFSSHSLFVHWSLHLIHWSIAHNQIVICIINLPYEKLWLFFFFVLFVSCSHSLRSSSSIKCSSKWQSLLSTHSVVRSTDGPECEKSSGKKYTPNEVKPEKYSTKSQINYLRFEAQDLLNKSTNQRKRKTLTSSFWRSFNEWIQRKWKRSRKEIFTMVLFDFVFLVIHKNSPKTKSN